MRTLGEVTVFGFLRLFLVDLFLSYWLQFDGIYRDYFEIATALRAGDDFSLIDVVLFDIEIGLAFRTINHNCLRSDRTPPVNI